MDFKDRLKDARLKKNLSQGKLAKLIGVHVMNISRYERGEHMPTTDMLTKLADALNVTTDYMMGGNVDDKAQTVISDKELLAQFQDVAKLPDDKKTIVKELIDAFLFKTKIQKQLAL